jgi:hypothetical protein
MEPRLESKRAGEPALQGKSSGACYWQFWMESIAAVMPRSENT